MTMEKARVLSKLPFNVISLFNGLVYFLQARLLLPNLKVSALDRKQFATSNVWQLYHNT